jgi:hypothetical protein
VAQAIPADAVVEVFCSCCGRELVVGISESASSSTALSCSGAALAIAAHPSIEIGIAKKLNDLEGQERHPSHFSGRFCR